MLSPRFSKAWRCIIIKLIVAAQLHKINQNISKLVHEIRQRIRKYYSFETTPKCIYYIEKSTIPSIYFTFSPISCIIHLLSAINASYRCGRGVPNGQGQEWKWTGAEVRGKKKKRKETKQNDSINVLYPKEDFLILRIWGLEREMK